ncbi:hypothetical protein [Dyella mobilis]|uniref:Uncharacterized protein n=1 Tax=Dyella mobilis TaxID=1849582 RepID=A0ABS2KDI1_9GAMM|nr:hypothetical protein [Dyella mobilis]MBM7128832.1 hypothetical protein [Dyella mobilis]GLQ99163.1 hypothetical protein GCM10007863_35830 [Dyella mobilis]
MIHAMIFGALGPLLMGVVFYFVMWGRPREKDQSGYPAMRFVGSPYVILVCGLVFTGFGAFQWFVPLNHHYSGNLAMLCYAPIALGVVCFLFSIYLASYLAVLTPDAITVNRWPFGRTDFSLGQLASIEEKGKQAFLHFKDGRKLSVTYMLSGSQDFIKCVEDRRIHRDA